MTAPPARGAALKPRYNLYRRVSRLENEAVLDRMAARLDARPEILDLRRESVEHPFGTIKQWMNQGAFLMRRNDVRQGLALGRRIFVIGRGNSFGFYTDRLRLIERSQWADSDERLGGKAPIAVKMTR